MKLEEALDILKEAKIEVTKSKYDFNYTLTDDYVIFPTIEDIVKCFMADETKNYQYIKGTHYSIPYIGNTEDCLVTVVKKDKKGYWIDRIDFDSITKYKMNIKHDVLLTTDLPVLNSKGTKQISFDEFMAKREEITTIKKAYEDYSKELKALGNYVAKRMKEMAEIYKINAE